MLPFTWGHGLCLVCPCGIVNQPLAGDSDDDHDSDDTVSAAKEDDTATKHLFLLLTLLVPDNYCCYLLKLLVPLRLPLLLLVHPYSSYSARRSREWLLACLGVALHARPLFRLYTSKPLAAPYSPASRWLCLTDKPLAEPHQQAVGCAVFTKRISFVALSGR